MIWPVWPCASQMVWSGRHEQSARRAGVLQFADVVAVGVEHLDAGVVAVGDVEQSLGVEHQRMRQVEFAGALALFAEGLDEVAVAIELQHQRLALAVALQHEQIAARSDHRLVRLVEQPQMAVLVPLAGAVFAAQHHLQPPGGIEAIDQMGGDVGRPDVVVGIDAQPMRPLEQAVAEAADEMAVRVELHQRHRAAVDDEDVALGVEGDARGAAEIGAGRQLERFGNRNVVER